MSRRATGGGLWVFVAILLIPYASMAMEPPNPGMTHRVVAIVGLVGGLASILLAWWVDGRRAPRITA